jgi:hypothetical protein
MNIQTVANNLRKTIAGKEKYRAEMREDIVKYNQTENPAVAKFLDINIAELKRILQDVEQCCEKATADSWAVNPDRSGGAYTDEEINRADEWR